MTEELKAPENDGKKTERRLVSTILQNGTIVEMVHRPEEGRTLFCLGTDNRVTYEKDLVVAGERVVPYSPQNNLLQHEVVLLPSMAEEYGTEERLIGQVRDFIHRYVDLSPLFETMATYYILLSWVYDAFNELPYLRLRGDPGSGKTRGLLVIGSLCYKPIFASGASTVSPLFRILDTFRGTLVVDEGDFRLSDERAEIVKILNNGNARGFPVLRTEVTTKHEFNPTAYEVFGPKLVATRGYFEDRALESRCLTEEMGQGRLRDDIPINHPAEVKVEARTLRNQLLMFRFRHRSRCRIDAGAVDRTLEPRLNQIFLPLVSVIEDEKARRQLQQLARLVSQDLVADRGLDTEAHVLEVIRDLQGTQPPRLSVKDITTWFADRHGEDYERKVTTKWIGSILRRRLHLRSEKSHGVYVLAESEGPRLRQLFERYGVDPEADPKDPGQAREIEAPVSQDLGDVGDLNEGPRVNGTETPAG